MNQQEAKGMLLTMVGEMLEAIAPEDEGRFVWTPAQLADRMHKRYCHQHLAHFCDAFAPGACHCGQAVCPRRLTSAVAACISLPPSNASVPTSSAVH